MRWGWSFALVCAFGAPSLHPSFASGDLPANAGAGVVLAQWERASAGLLGVGPLEHRRMHHLHEGRLTAHEIAILNEFRGAVSALDLAQRFDWSVKETAGKTVLIGKPTDEVVQLFYEELIVTIDPETHLPTSVSFHGTPAGHTGEALAVVVSPRIEEPNRFPHDPSARPIQVASRNEESPRNPSPIRVVEHIARKARTKPELPADVEHALMAWETAANEARSLHANVKRYTYEAKSHVEHRAVGELRFSAPAIIQCTLKPAPIDPHAKSHRRTSGGAAYELLPSPAEFWQYTPTAIQFSHQPHQPLWVLAFEEGSKPAWIVSQAEHAPVRQEDTIVPPWPMLFRPRALELAERFSIRVSDHPQVATWEFIPRTRGDLGQFQLMRVLLEKTSFRPQAVQFINGSGDIEVVYTLDYTQAQNHARRSPAPELLPVNPPAPEREPAPTTLHGLP